MMMGMTMVVTRGRTVWVPVSWSVGWTEPIPVTPWWVMVSPPGAVVTVVKPRGWGKTMVRTWRWRKPEVLTQWWNFPIRGLSLIRIIVARTLELGSHV